MVRPSVLRSMQYLAFFSSFFFTGASAFSLDLFLGLDLLFGLSTFEAGAVDDESLPGALASAMAASSSSEIGSGMIATRPDRRSSR